MIFVRVVVSHTRNAVSAVFTQDWPFERAMAWAEGEECEAVDLGVVDDHTWNDSREGNRPCEAHRHICHRLLDAKISARDLLERRVSGELHVEGLSALADVLGVRRIIDAPCSLESLKAHLRAKGPNALHVGVRAWLANILPPHQVDALGIGRNIPISAQKSAEALRIKRDPHSGSRMAHLERIAERRSNDRSAARLARRTVEG